MQVYLNLLRNFNFIVYHNIYNTRKKKCYTSKIIPIANWSFLNKQILFKSMISHQTAELDTKK